jgi:hypothetical protein
VDDTLLYSPKQECIDEVLENLRNAEMNLEVENDIAGFLGVHMDKRDDGIIHMTQTGHIQRVVKALDIADRNPKETPAEYGAFPVDKFGDSCQGVYMYVSVIGMLLYLSGHTRPNIAFAVSQCTRYKHSPQHS